MRRLLPILVGLIVALGTMPTTAASPPPKTDAPESGSSTTEVAGGLERPRDRETVLLRVSTVGGLAGDTTALLAIPTFSLYGDGTVLIPRTTYTNDDLERTILLTTTLDAELTERVLFAASDVLGPRLGREGRDARGREDAMTTIFSIDTGDLSGALYVDALGTDPDDAFLVELVRTLADPGFWQVVDREPEPYEPQAYLASFVEEDPELPGVLPWPWGTDVPADALLPAIDSGLVATATLTPAQVDSVTDIPAGPRSDIILGVPDGRALRMFLRPLLPDELAAVVGQAG